MGEAGVVVGMVVTNVVVGVALVEISGVVVTSPFPEQETMTMHRMNTVVISKLVVRILFIIASQKCVSIW